MEFLDLGLFGSIFQLDLFLPSLEEEEKDVCPWWVSGSALSSAVRASRACWYMCGKSESPTVTYETFLSLDGL